MDEWIDGFRVYGLGKEMKSPTGRSQGLIFKEAREECKSFHWLVLWHGVAWPLSIPNSLSPTMSATKRVPKETPQHKESVGQLIWSATQSTFVHRFAVIFNLNNMVKDRHCRCLIRPQLGTLHPTIAWLSEQYYVALDLLLHAKPSPRWQLGGTDEE